MKIEISLKGEIDDDEFNGLNTAIDNLVKNWIWYKKTINYEQTKSK